MKLFIDEAGYTGPDLLNQAQPVLVRASTVLEDREAEEYVATAFSDLDRGNELKHSRLCRTNRWRASVVAFISGLPKKQIAFYAFHKEFTLLAYLIDFWLEPMAYRDGFNLYEHGANIALCNVSYFTLRTTLGVRGFRELLRRFQVMTRDRTRFSYDSFWTMMYDAIRRHDLVEKLLVGLIVAEKKLGWPHLQDLPHQVLDLGEYGVLDTIVHWRREIPKARFEIVHDDSKLLQKHRKVWDRILSQDARPAVVGQDRRTIEFPLPVDGLTLAHSSDHIQLQVADVVAGAASALMSAFANGKPTEYSQALEESGLLSALAGGVWPTTKIDPKDLETEGPALEDAADYIGRLMSGEPPDER